MRKFDTLSSGLYMEFPFMLVVYIFLALFIAWIWVDYFRLIDVFEKDNLGRVILTFLMGASSVLLVIGLHQIWPEPLWLTLDGTLLNDFLYCTFSIGLVEETAKTVPVLLTLYFFRKHINEPVDYVATFSVAALGFAAAENVLYFNNFGADLISSRAILSNVGHMLFASLTAYGVILIKFRHLKPGFLLFPLFLLLASIFHGIYNVGLMYTDAGWIGVAITILFFFLGISVFATILNNALNISPFFSYKHVIHSTGVAVRMLVYYVILFAAQVIVVGATTDTGTVLRLVINHSYTILPIVLITIIRLSRFKLIQNRWSHLRPELPFRVSFGRRNLLGVQIGIKGDPYSDFHVNKHYETHFLLCPISGNSPYLKECRKAYLFKKVYINGDVAHYAARIFTDEAMQESQSVLLQIKREGRTRMGGFPIVAILEAENVDAIETSAVRVRTTFIEWAAMKPVQAIS
jgi:RsiW-degrading membrane proteinase PrsW (M82 family)